MNIKVRIKFLSSKLGLKRMLWMKVGSNPECHNLFVYGHKLLGLCPPNIKIANAI
jgi:hypothetical protein